MERYDIEFKPSVYKALKKLPSKDTVAIFSKIYELDENPRPIGRKKLAGTDYYRLRYRHYRILYTIEDGKLMILVIKIRHRRNIYG